MLQKLTSSIQGFSAERRLEYKTIPLLILGIALVAFGIKTLSVGFFHDDWHHVYYAHFYGLEGLKQLSFFDSRPFVYFVYWPLFSLLGSSPLNSGASRFGNNIRPALCEVWLGLEPTGQETPEKSAAYREVSEKLRCNFE